MTAPGARILVVDDDERMAAILRASLMKIF
jgi:DNA-binding response OmpR family regulator